jgi:hypothetical protein
MSVFGQGLSVGLTDVTAVATPLARAHAIGALVPQIGSQTEQTAETSTDGETVTGAETCGPITLPADIPVIDLASACSAVEASIGGAGPAGSATGRVDHLAVSATDLLGTLGDLGLPVETTVDDAVAQLLAGLAPLFDTLDDAGLDAESLVQSLLDAISDGGDLVSIDLGPASSATTTDAGSVLANGLAQGAVVRVLDRALLQLPPVLTIEVGAAGSHASADRASGAAVASVDPSLVRITVAEDIATLLGLPENVIEVAPGQEVCLPLPDPLGSCVSVASGRILATPDGGQRAESEGVSLRLLTGLPEGGVVLGLAATSAEAVAVPVQAPLTPAVEVPESPALPRTGGDAGPLPLAAAVAALAAGLAARGARRARA